MFNSVLGNWMLSYKYISNGISSILKIYNIFLNDFYVQCVFFPVTFFLLFIVSFVKKVEKLKIFAYVGFGLVLYIVFSFIILTPTYYNFYNKLGQLHFHLLKWNYQTPRVIGICFFLFINQYSIIPICYRIGRKREKETHKIILCSTVILVIFDSLLAIIGYLSEPDEPTNEIFLLRKSITNTDYLILLGKIGFGITLFITLMLKFFYLLTYLDQLIKRFRIYFLSQEHNSQENLDKYPNTEEHTVVTISFLIKILLLLTIMLFLALLLIDQISLILSFTGTFVGLFEIIVFPSNIISNNALKNR